MIEVILKYLLLLQAPAPSKKKKTEEDTSPPMNLTVPKERRFKDEKSLKVCPISIVCV